MLIAWIGDTKATLRYICDTSVPKWQASPLLHTRQLRCLRSAICADKYLNVAFKNQNVNDSIIFVKVVVNMKKVSKNFWLFLLIACIGDAKATLRYICDTSVPKWRASPFLHLRQLRCLRSVICADKYLNVAFRSQDVNGSSSFVKWTVNLKIYTKLFDNAC